MRPPQLNDLVSLPDGWDENDNPNPPIVARIIGFYGPGQWPIVCANGRKFTIPPTLLAPPNIITKP